MERVNFEMGKERVEVGGEEGGGVGAWGSGGCAYASVVVAGGCVLDGSLLRWSESLTEMDGAFSKI